MEGKEKDGKGLISNLTAIMKSAIDDLDRLQSSEEVSRGISSFSFPGSSNANGNGSASTGSSSSTGVGSSSGYTCRKAGSDFQIRANENFRRAFPSGRSQTRHPEPEKTKGKGKASRRYTPYFKPKESWTHNFCILGGVKDDTTPTKEQLMDLQKSGLGRKKVVFPSNKANHEQLIEALENECPKLKDGGGVELLYAVGGGGGQRQLATIPPGPEGYTIHYLRCTVCVGQAVTYARPLQQDLDLSPQSYEFELEGGPTVECITCGQKVNYGHLKNHREKECRASAVKDCGSTSEFVHKASHSLIDLTSGNEVIGAEGPTAADNINVRSPLACTYETEEDILNVLKNMFPDIDEAHLKRAAGDALDSNEAVNAVCEEQNQKKDTTHKNKKDESSQCGHE